MSETMVVGGSPNGHTRAIAVRLTPARIQEIERLAGALGISRSAVLRFALDRGLRDLAHTDADPLVRGYLIGARGA